MMRRLWILLALAALLAAGCPADPPEPGPPTASSPTPSPSPSESPSPTPSPPESNDAFIPPEIPDDCSVDVTAQINAWIGTVPDGSDLFFSENACYRNDGTILVESRLGLAFDGRGSTFQAFVDGTPRECPKCPGGHRDHWTIQESSGIALRNMTIVGSDLTPGTFEWQFEFQHGVYLPNPASSDVLVENVNVLNVHGDFVTLGGHRADPHRNVTVRGGNHFGSGRQGIAVVDAIGVVIEGGIYDRIGMSVFDLEPCGPCTDQIENITIRHNIIGDFNHLLVPAFGICQPGPCVPKLNVLVEGNIILQDGGRYGSDHPTITVSGASKGWVIRGNDWIRYRGPAINFSSAEAEALVECNRVTWLTRGADRVEALVQLRGGTASIRHNRLLGFAEAVWTGEGQVEDVGNVFGDDPLPVPCG